MSSKISRIRLLVAIGIIFGSIFCSQNAQAYYKVNEDSNYACYAIVYTKDVTPFGDKTVENGAAKATEQVCAKLKEDGSVNGTLIHKNIPNGYNEVQVFPILRASDGSNSVKLTYCTNTSMPALICNTIKNFDYTGGKFEDFVKNIQTFIEDNTTLTSNYTLQSFKENKNTATINEDIKETNAEEKQEEMAKNKCFSSAGALGWVACPIMQKINETLKNIYSNMVEPFLTINADLLNGDSGTYAAWTAFQNIANVIFIILLLVVILSQATGVGVSNYGIKKMLPKLILSAILINLSFIICQLAVDISNILGTSLNSLLSNIAAGVDARYTGSSQLFDGILATLTSVIGIGGGAVLVHIALDGGMITAILIPLLLGLITAVIAVIFFFILLGVRKAGVVIFVAIAPVAFACYILPNTKILFDKWLKIFKGLLIIYPLAGLLIGGGSLASAILLQSPTDGVSGFLIYLIALLLMVVPFFLLPSMIKGSMNVMGNLGNKITGFGQKSGQRLSGRAGKAITGSERYKFWQQQSGLTHSNRIMNRYGGKDINKLSGAQRAMLSSARSGIAADQSRRRKEYADYFEHADSASIEKAFNSGLANGEIEQMDAAFDALLATGNMPKIHKALDAIDNDKWGKMSSDMKLRLQQKMIKSGDVSMKAFAKYAFKPGNNSSWNDFVSGDSNGGSLRESLKSLGSHALDGQDKDSLEYISKHAGDAGVTAAQMVNAAASTTNGEELNHINNMIHNVDKDELSDAITPAALTKLSSKTLEAIGDTDTQLKVLGKALAEIQQPQNATLYASLNSAARTLVGQYNNSLNQNNTQTNIGTPGADAVSE